MWSTLTTLLPTSGAVSALFTESWLGFDVLYQTATGAIRGGIPGAMCAATSVVCCFGVKKVYEADDYSPVLNSIRAPVADALLNVHSRVVALTAKNQVDIIELKNNWQSLAVPRNIVVTKGHSHGLSAGYRTAAQRTIIDWIDSIGREPYFVSSSTRDKEGAAATHHLIEFKDLWKSPKFDKVEKYHVIVMIDVDYYVDIAYWLSFGVPIMLYTITPSKLSMTDGEMEYHINEDDTMKMTVSGGNTYIHKLWNYSHDTVHVRTGLFSSFVVAIDQKKLAMNETVMSVDAEGKTVRTMRTVPDPHHRVIALFPMVKIGITGWFASAPGIRRAKFFRKFVGGDVIVHEYLAHGTSMVSLRLPGTHTSVEVKRFLYDAICTNYTSGLSSSGKSLFSKASIEAHLKRDSDNYNDFKVGEQATLLFPIVQRTHVLPVGNITHEAGIMARPNNWTGFERVHYRVDGENMHNDEKFTGRNFSEPFLLHPALLAYSSKASEECSIKERVYKPSNPLRNVPGEYNAYRRDFVEQLLFENRNIGQPISDEDLYEQQNRPTQRRRLDMARDNMVEEDKTFIKAFQKRETYPKAGAPRNISQVSDIHTYRLSKYTTAFKRDVLKNMSWYGPCKTPRESASVLGDLAANRKTLVETDWSKFDGSINQFLRELEIMVYSGWAAAEHKNEVTKLIRAEINTQGITTNGVLYYPGCGRLSGSPLTTDGNTMINAFLSYCAKRKDKCQHLEAWDNIGLLAGDDGVITCTQESIEAVSAEMNMSVKAFTRCEDGSKDGRTVGYLARHFPHIWDGNLGSLQDPIRQLGKLHLTCSPMDMDIAEAACNKLRGILQLDPQSPIISELCHKMVQHYYPLLPESVTKNYEDRIDFLTTTAEYTPGITKTRADLPYVVALGFSNIGLFDEFNGWPQLDREDQETVACASLGIDTVQLQRILELIVNSTPSEIVSLPKPLIENEQPEHLSYASIGGEPTADGSLAPDVRPCPDDRRGQDPPQGQSPPDNNRAGDPKSGAGSRHAAQSAGSRIQQPGRTQKSGGPQDRGRCPQPAHLEPGRNRLRDRSPGVGAVPRKREGGPKSTSGPIGNGQSAKTLLGPNRSNSNKSFAAVTRSHGNNQTHAKNTSSGRHPPIPGTTKPPSADVGAPPTGETPILKRRPNGSSV